MTVKSSFVMSLLILNTDGGSVVTRRDMRGCEATLACQPASTRGVVAVVPWAYRFSNRRGTGDLSCDCSDLFGPPVQGQWVRQSDRSGNSVGRLRESYQRSIRFKRQRSKRTAIAAVSAQRHTQ